ncbi:MAG TPA: Ni/Fe hydrogenase subunit alpha [Candidatus Sulfopaludibacter sp.]|jgi:NAD-reducing hydrogenase large subunit|nr:Ni/Fe hydrogenase subunit alpha [Candidatus Sulfopaludibacter sp.]
MKKLTIDPVTRIEGHAKIDIFLDDQGRVADTHFHVTQVRGFEKFVEGRPFYEMPAITSRICGICPVSHLLASAKACDAIMSVTPPETGVKLRELVHCAQFVQSHALNFFHLSAPDMLMGFDSDPARRNIFGLIEDHPDVAKAGVALHKFGQEIIAALANERIHPSWIVPGGVNAPLTAEARGHMLAELPGARQHAVRTLAFYKTLLDQFAEEIENFGTTPTLYAGLVDGDGHSQWYEGLLQFKDADGCLMGADIRGRDYAEFIGEASLKKSYLKAPYFKPIGYPDGVYRVGPLGRVNASEDFGTPEADAELAEFRRRYGPVVHSSFHYHYARLLELLHGLEKIELLLNDPAILGKRVRAHAGVNCLEGVGMVEAPRGVLIHHYKVDENGAMRWCNLIVATGHNNLAINRSIGQVARHFIDGEHFKEGMLNRVSAVVRAYDPCLSCSTHADGTLAMPVRLIGPDGRVLDTR